MVSNGKFFLTLCNHLWYRSGVQGPQSHRNAVTSGPRGAITIAGIGATRGKSAGARTQNCSCTALSQQGG